MFGHQPHWKRGAIALVAVFVVGCSSTVTTAAPTSAPATAAPTATMEPRLTMLHMISFVRGVIRERNRGAFICVLS